MGASESQPLPPWYESAGVEYAPAIRDALVALSSTAAPFLHANPEYFQSFELEAHLPRLQGALTFDANIMHWYPKLVPRRVTEEAFWQNYFSHVAAIVTEGQGQGREHELEQYRHSANGTLLGHDQPAAPSSGSSTPSKPSTPSISRSSSIGGAALPPLTQPHLLSPASSPVSGLKLNLAAPFSVDSQRLTSVPILRWGIIGCGEAVQTRGLPALLGVSGARVVAIASRTGDACQAVANRFGITKVHAGVAALLADPDVDAVYIATPPGTHAVIAIEAARAGKPCLIERTMARTADECRLMVDEFARLSVPLYASQPKRFLPKFLALQQLVKSHIGTVVAVQYTCANAAARAPHTSAWRHDAEMSGGGCAMEFATDVFDVLDFALGPCTHIQGDAIFSPLASTATGAAPLENAVVVSFRTGSSSAQPVLGTASFNFVSGASVDQLVVLGTDGQVSVSIFGDDAPVAIVGGRAARVSIPSVVHAHTPFFQQVTSELRLWRGGAALGATTDLASQSALGGVRASQVLDAMLRTYYRNRLDAFWTRPATWRHGRPPAPKQPEEDRR